MPAISRGITKRRKYTLSRQAVARARTVLRRRDSVPMRPGGFYGVGQRGELKSIDVTLVGEPISQTAHVALLNGVATGTDYNARIGRQTKMKSIYLRVTFEYRTLSGAIGDFIRMLVIYDRQPNGVALTAANVLQGGSYIDPINLDNRDRFSVIADKMMTFNPVQYSTALPSGGNPANKHVKIYKKMNLTTQYSGTGATVGSIQTGSVYIILLGANYAAGNEMIRTDYYSRIRFVDA